MSIEFQSHHFEQERAYAEQQERRARAEAFARETADAIPYFNRQYRDELTALAIGARPAVGFGRSEYPEQQINAAALERAASKIEGLKLVGQFLLNPEAVARRASDEPELALEVGWDETSTVEENAMRASSDRRSPFESQQLYAFIIGFPPTAIRDFPEVMRRTEHGDNPDPEVRTVRILGPNGEISYAFRVVGSEHERAPDIVSLREKVERAFRDAGYGK